MQGKNYSHRKRWTEGKAEVLKTAYFMYKEHCYETFDKCLLMAAKRVFIQSRLKQGMSYFTYKKKNGQERVALGTLDEEHLIDRVKGDKMYTLAQVRYFDVGKTAWRSFLLENFGRFYW